MTSIMTRITRFVMVSLIFSSNWRSGILKITALFVSQLGLSDSERLKAPENPLERDSKMAS